MQYVRSLVAAAALALGASAAMAATTFDGKVDANIASFDVSVAQITFAGTSDIAGNVFSSDYKVEETQFLTIPGIGKFPVTVKFDGYALNFQSAYLSLGKVVVGTDSDLSDGFTFKNVLGGTYDLHLTGTSTNKVLPGVFGGAYTVSAVPPVTPAVPEPGSVALVLAGLGVVGVMSRRRLG